MDKKQFNRLEAYLEQFIEGAFANLLGSRIRAPDVALRLARAMETGAKPALPGNSQPIAPDQYTIYAHPNVQSHLLSDHPDLLVTLAEHLVELATQSGYRLEKRPAVRILADSNLDNGSLRITASHTKQDSSSTAAMKAVAVPVMNHPKNAHLLIDRERKVSLEQNVINVGRHPENDIVIDDPRVSRHHLQLRLRYGSYILFDIDSRTGTTVNGTPTRETPLQPGDIIHIGNTQLIYLHDQTDDDDLNRQATDAFPSI
jgi:hypothetical protein